MAGTTYVESGCGQRAAAISYHVLFSLVPFLAVLLTVLDLVLPDSAHDRVVNWLVGIAHLPIDVSTSVEGAIQQAGTPASVAGAIALAGFIWAASGMMGAMRLAFMAVWGGEVRRPYLRGKLLDGALVLGAGLLILTAFGLTIVVQVATETSTKIADELGFGERATGGDRSAGAARRLARARLRRLRAALPGRPSRPGPAPGRAARALRSRRSASISRSPASPSISTTSPTSTTSTGRSEQCSRSCCSSGSRPRSCSSARASPPSGRRPRSRSWSMRRDR